MEKHLSFIEINSTNLRANIASFRNILPSGNRLVAVVKANAYGHGLKEILQIAEPFVDAFQVDDIEELREARNHSNKPIYVFGYVLKEHLREAVSLRGTLGVYDLEHLSLLNEIGKEMNAPITIHLKIDALLGRQGILREEVERYAEEIKKLPFIKIEAVYSHFSNIEDTDNLSHAKVQHRLLIAAKDAMHAHGFQDIWHHISATSGILVDQSQNWSGSMLRLGIGMYGLWPSRGLEIRYGSTIQLKPVLSWITHIAQVKRVPAGYPIGYGLTAVTKQETTIAVIPNGYSDGYDRKLSNNAEVIIRGEKCPILGRVAMNMFVVDVSRVSQASAEDEVHLIGTEEHEAITAESLAEKIGTINYEVVSRISPLLPRIIK
jgi:alanine racemase